MQAKYSIAARIDAKCCISGTREVFSNPTDADVDRLFDVLARSL